MLLTSQYTITKEQLFADLQRDGVHVSVELLNRAKRGDSEAFYDIGILYISKEGNEDKVLPWFLLSAGENNPDAQYHIGLMYHYGQNASIDYHLAMDWYLKAAKQSHLRACMEIGYLYQSGYGVPANEELAFQWFCKSKELSKEKNGVQQKDILELISYSEVVVSLDKEKRAIDERKSNLKNQRNENHQALKQELARRDSMIQALTMENQNIQEKASQEVLKKDITMKHLEVEKQQILTELNQLKHQATERLQYFTQRNKTLEDKLETKNKQVGQLQSENCTLQNLLKLKQYQHGQYRQQTEQQQSYKYLLQHQYHQNSESKLLSEPESNTAALLKQENQKLLNEINTLKASSTQFEQEAKAGKEKLIMLQTINQSLRDSNDQMTKMTERLEKSNQSYVEVLEQEKQKIAQEVEVLKQGNIDLEKKMSHLGAKQVAQEPRIQNIIKQKDRKIKALELDLQKLHTLYDQTTFEAHEMMTILNNQNGALEEENQTVRDELEFKVACEKKLESKIASLEKEMKRLKCLSASFEYETSL